MGYGDNQSSLRLLECPDGPWRTRHLRLRSFVLRERMKRGLWKGRHVPGAQLASDLLTKAVTSMPSWTKSFYNFMSMHRLDELNAAEPSGCTEGRVTAKVAGAVLAAIIGLTVATTLPKEAESTKVACAVSVAALTAWLVKKLGPGGIKNVVREDTLGPTQKSIGSTTVNLRKGLPKSRTSKQDARWKMNPGQNIMAQGDMNLCQILE